MSFSPAVVIAKKRDGESLTADEIHTFIQAYTLGNIPDYQMSALAMAIYWRSMSTDETAALTEAMLESGIVLDWPDDGRAVVDKHSTGGIGDKVSLLLAPLLACSHCRNPMISGRGLGATGGTLDKLESIPGFRTNLDVDEITQVTGQIGCVITGASARIAPADKKLYALRDVTATVPSIPLITASIMSKKLAEGLDALVLDVKFGSGSFMKELSSAHALAQSLVSTGERMGVRTTALLTDMNQPLGRMVGNAVEVDETIAALQGNGPADLIEVTLELGAELLTSAGTESTVQQARQRLQGHLDSGRAFEKFQAMVAAQGGDLNAPRPVAECHELRASQTGWLQAVDAEAIGQVLIEYGGGRKVMSDAVDHSVGLEMRARIGDQVEQGALLARVFAHPNAYQRTQDSLQAAFSISAEPAPPLPLIVEHITTP
ncbi:MAG: thymidine phosphorylase [Blastopirellula sp.]|nr:thymidine phosphorylase [Blastopirellula sp.]MAR10428.1 thymidine phosphorylase [Blastopirellula sp.]